MRALIFALALLPLPALAQSPVVTQAVEAHILPRMETLAATGTALANAAQADCHPTAPDLRAALRALEADGHAFRALVDDEHGEAWELVGQPEAGVARLLLSPAGPARREIARLRGMLSVLAEEREVAAENQWR